MAHHVTAGLVKAADVRAFSAATEAIKKLGQLGGFETDEVAYVTGKKDLSDASFALSDAINVLTDCGEIDAAHKLQEINRAILAKQNAQLAEIERKRVLSAAFSELKKDFDIPAEHADYLYALYDKGYLRMPD
jgi:hypothetical protein